MGDHIQYRHYDNMDVLFYEQQTHQQASNAFHKYDKNSMRLNLRPSHVTDQENHRPQINDRNSNIGMFHHSPDINGMFKIVSPELERFIGNNTGLTPRGNQPGPIASPEFPLFSLVSPEFEKILASIQNKTPTPTRILREGNSVAKQREVYVQGFAEALQHIHDQQQHTQQEQVIQEHKVEPVQVNHYSWQTERTHDSSSHYDSRENSRDSDSARYVTSTEHCEQDIKVNHMTATYEQSVSDFDETSIRSRGLNVLPLPPINLELQEIVKRERKKQKNRVAASKCRRKKLEREAQLEVRVQQLKEKNIELNAVASALRQQVGELKQRVLEHVAFGCQLPTVTTAAY